MHNVRMGLPHQSREALLTHPVKQSPIWSLECAAMQINPWCLESLLPFKDQGTKLPPKHLPEHLLFPWGCTMV